MRTELCLCRTVVVVLPRLLRDPVTYSTYVLVSQSFVFLFIEQPGWNH